MNPKTIASDPMNHISIIDPDEKGGTYANGNLCAQVNGFQNDEERIAFRDKLIEAYNRQANKEACLNKLYRVAIEAIEYVGSANYDHRERAAKLSLMAAHIAARRGDLAGIVFNPNKYMPNED